MPSATRRASAWRRRSRASTWRGSRAREGIVAKKFAGLTGLIKARDHGGHREGRLVVDDDGPAVAVGEDTYRGADVLATGSHTRTLPGIEIGGRSSPAKRPSRSRGARASSSSAAGSSASSSRARGARWARRSRSSRRSTTSREDIASSKALERAFRKRGIVTSTRFRFAGVTQTDAGVTIVLEDGSELSADYLLVAVGRGPATAGMGFEEAGVARARLREVDERLRPPARLGGGDIVPGLQLAHRAFSRASSWPSRSRASAPSRSRASIPRVTYSHPEVASVGLTEAAARAAHGDAVAVYEYNLAGNGKSEIIGTGGIVKVVRRSTGPSSASTWSAIASAS
jgi:dihydrolipoamide dehydrogenase